jgi:HAE1 family hydrophobic/amphiphilic exporter-1
MNGSISSGPISNGLSSWSIRHPVPTVVLFLFLTGAGVLGFTGLRTNNMPDIDMPTVTVTVAQSGAAPTELETQVTRIVENAVAGVGNVDDISSTVGEGSSTTTIRFILGTDVDRATNDVRNAVAGIQGNLPAGAESPVIARMDDTGRAILTFVVEAPAMAPDGLSWFVDNDVGKALLGVDGVSKVERSGGVDRVIRIELDPDRLAALGVRADEISRTLADVNVNQPGGRASVGGREQSVRTLGSAVTVAALADTRVRLAGGGGSVRLADLGTVRDGWEEPRQRARLDGKEVVAFSVFRSVGSSEIDVTGAVRAAVAKLDRSRADVTFREVTSSSDFVAESYAAAVEALWIGALLAVGVVWLFLRDIRATLISSVALPLSLIPTFAVMRLLDLSLNNITLLALSLVVGILVDDAIVEIENIVRHMRHSGKRAWEAAIEAADEIGLAVVATTGTIVAVFLPVAFMPGIPGQIFKSFAIATCVSVAFSLLVARMLTPLMGAFLIRAEGHRDDAPKWVPAYLWLLRKALRRRWVTLALGVAFFAGSMGLARLLPMDFMPASDRGRSLVSVQLPPGATLAETDAVVQGISARLRGEPEVAGIFASIGTPTSAGMGPQAASAGEVRSAAMTVNLVPRGERSVSQQAFEKRASAMLAGIPGARIQFGADGQSGAKVSVTLTGDDPAALNAARAALLRDMRTVPGFLNPVSTSAISRSELIIRPDDARAAEVGVTPTAIALAVQVATLGDTDRNLPKFNLGDRQIPILAALPQDALNDPSRLAVLPVSGTRATVPLGSIAEIGFGAGPTSILRVDRRRSATVEANLSSLTLGEASARVAALPTMRALPPGVTELKRGDEERMRELFTGFATALTAGIFLMYATLVLLFRSFVQPVTIMVALPLSVGGALGFLLLSGNALAISALIGLLLLMGIAAKNSILLVDYALMARTERGLDRTSALLDAAAKRARPIVMTSLAMGAGMLPLALGWGADAETRAPMAIAVIGGLLSSTVLSLVYVPVFFTVMDDLERLLGRWLRPLAVGAETPAHAKPTI